MNKRTKPKPRIRMLSHFRKELLPVPKVFYQDRLGKLSRPSRGWVKGNCCFHQSKSRTSFSIHLESGAFYCHGCGAKGGDIVSLLRQRDGLSFKEACQQLGCWEEDGKPIKPHPGPPVCYLVMDFVIDGTEYHAVVKDETKSDLELFRRYHAEANDRLREIRRGDTENFEGEEEVQWGILASSWELIQMEVTSAR